MKKVVLLLMIVAVSISYTFSYSNAFAEENERTRTINVVYDDSGSMIVGTSGTEEVDTWCQAKYSLEVFAAMLGKNDLMNVYTMSDFSYNSNASPHLTLKGSDGRTKNVAKVHNMLTDSLGTPFDTVRKAYSDLTKTKTDEKWLVILTDGEFQDVGGDGSVNNFIAAKKNDINVVFLGIGADAAVIKENPSANIFCEKASGGDDILGKITDICTRVFNTNKLVVNADKREVSFDVPMSELIVFAQGTSVNVGNIKQENNSTISPASSVEVKYSEVSSKNYSKSRVNKSLLGSIATFEGDLNPGNYSLDVSGADTLEVYYKPNVDVQCILKDKDGNIIEDKEIRAGEYILEFAIVKGGTTEPVPKSQLLGELTFSATLTQDEGGDSITVKDGDTIVLKEGGATLKSVAQYLEYNYVRSEKNFFVFKDRTISFEVIKNVDYTVKKDGIVNGSDPIEVGIKIDGKEMTQEQWDALDAPSFSPSGKIPFDMGEFKTEKSDTIGILNVFPATEEHPDGAEHSDCEYTISHSQTVGKELWTGTGVLLLKLSDERSFFEKNRDLIIKLIIFGILAIIALGYLIKKRLPGDLAKTLEIQPEKEDSPSSFGRYSKTFGKNLISTETLKLLFCRFAPFVAQRGRIKFTNVDGIPEMKIKAGRGGSFRVVNSDEYVDKPVWFGSKTAQKGKKLEISSANKCKTDDGIITYTCELKRQRKGKRRGNRRGNRRGKKR